MPTQVDPGSLPKVSPQQLAQADISPDGTVLQTSAKSGFQQTPAAPPTAPPVKSIADLPPADPPKAPDAPVNAPEPDIDFNQFVDAGAKAPGVNKDKIKPNETTQKPPATVPDDGTIKEGNKPTQQTKDAVQTQKPILPDNRDYSKYPPEEHAALKKMSNEAWTTFEKYYNEKKQLEAETVKLKKDYEEFKQKGPQIPDDYYSHPDAYLLDPAFRQQMQYQNEAQTILNHWQTQLQNVAQGAVEFDYLGRDPRTNQLAVTGKVKADRMSELQLQQYVMHSQNLVNEAAGNIRGMMQSHGVKHQSHVQNVKTLEAQMFGGMDAPDNKPIYEPLVKSKFEQNLKGFEHNPLAPGYAKALVMLEVLSKRVLQMQNGGGQTAPQQQQAAAIRNQGPSGNEINGDGGKGKSGVETDVSYDDFNKVKQGI